MQWNLQTQVTSYSKQCVENCSEYQTYYFPPSPAQHTLRWQNNLYSAVDLHIEAKILPCKYRRLMMLQKITFNELKENVALVDKKDIRTRAHDGILLYVPLPKTELFKKSNCYNKLVIWNNLPTQIRCITELGEFKSQIKRYYIRMFLSDYN